MPTRCAVTLLLALACVALAADDAAAVMLSKTDASGNTTPPADDPGFANLGIKSNLSAVYLGNRWVVTANHVGIGNVLFGGQTYAAIPGSSVRLKNPNETLADLIVFRLYDDPQLPTPTIATTMPNVNSAVTMIGHGRNRGNATQWMGIDGWEWGAGTSMRWGTNRIADNSELALDTQAFFTTFDDAGGLSDECQAAYGDSGGGVWWKSGGNWYLLGVMFAISEFVGQPANTALFGNRIYSADLTAYRSQTLALVTQPSCSDGLDDDGDGLIDHPNDPGCDFPTDDSERGPAFACDDDQDNDLDGAIDFPDDLDCDSPFDTSEEPTPAVPALGPAPMALLSLLLLACGAASTGAAAQSSNRTL